MYPLFSSNLFNVLVNFVLYIPIVYALTKGRRQKDNQGIKLEWTWDKSKQKIIYDIY